MPIPVEKAPTIGNEQQRTPLAHSGSAEAGASTAFSLATEAALEILRAGGNAVDAAVAAAWALSVCEPSGSGLGGQSTLLVYAAGGALRVIDGHSYAPAAASTETISAIQQRLGYRACTIPSTPATLAYAQRKYGVLSEPQVLAPAIRIAEEGYAITRLQHRQIRWVTRYLRASEGASALFLQNGEAPPPGYVFRQPELAATLGRLAEHGIEDFYQGGIARSIADDMRCHGGIITEDDLQSCGLPVEREPLCTSYRGFRIVTVPPPGGGLQLLLALKILEQLTTSSELGDFVSWYELIALATYAAFDGREKAPLDPEDLTPSLLGWLLSEERVREIAARIRNGQLGGQPFSAREGPGDTTHLNVADRAGNVVALTQSIQSVFGAKVANRDLGFVYNNYLCTCPRSAHPYGLAGNSQPRSNAAPTLVLRDTPEGSFPLLALGAAGSRRITSAIFQVISSVVDRGLSVQDAVAAPRVHARLSRKVWMEESSSQTKIVERLEKHFTRVDLKRAPSYKLGSVQALHWTNGERLTGAADPRRDGSSSTLQ